jgi:hypothetical protein
MSVTQRAAVRASPTMPDLPAGAERSSQESRGRRNEAVANEPLFLTTFRIRDPLEYNNSNSSAPEQGNAVAVNRPAGRR